MRRASGAIVLTFLLSAPAFAQPDPPPTVTQAPAATPPPNPPSATPDAPAPFPPMADPVHLPALNYRAGEDACRSWVQVQNIGGEPGKAVLLAWGPSTLCAPHCAGPIAAQCSGFLRPGATWRFASDTLPGGVKSGVVYSFNARTVAEAGGSGEAGDRLVADVMCERLLADVPGDCDEYLSFKRAFEAAPESGAAYAGLPLARAYGPALTAEVLRACQGDALKIRQAVSTYTGMAGRDFGGRDRVFNISSYHATLINHGHDGWNSVLYVQNGGPNCASVELWLQERDVCRPSRPCKTFTLAQGASLTVDLADCTAAGWEGGVWLNSSEPLAVAVDVFGYDTLMTYTAAPTELRYAWEGPPEFTAGSPQVFGPLIYGRDRGWDTRLHVQNLSSRSAAQVRVTFFSPDGLPIETTEPAWVCPYGSRAFTVRATDRLPGEWVGSARVESLPWPSPAPTAGPGSPTAAVPTPTPSRPNITAVAELVHRQVHSGAGGPESTVIDSALAYNLLPAPPAPERRGDIELPRGTTLIAVPSLVAQGDATGATSRLAVANYIPDPGRTDLVVLLFDANGMVDTGCLHLGPQAVAYLDFGGWGYVSPAFRGSAIISATAWAHPVYDTRHRVVDNRVGLAAVAVQQVGPDVQGDAEGDAFAAMAGVPFRAEGRRGFIPPGAAVPPCRPTAPLRLVARAWLPWVGR